MYCKYTANSSDTANRIMTVKRTNTAIYCNIANILQTVVMLQIFCEYTANSSNANSIQTANASTPAKRTDTEKLK